jgi:hypothetical protein
MDSDRVIVARRYRNVEDDCIQLARCESDEANNLQIEIFDQSRRSTNRAQQKAEVDGGGFGEREDVDGE